MHYLLLQLNHVEDILKVIFLAKLTVRQVACQNNMEQLEGLIYAFVKEEQVCHAVAERHPEVWTEVHPLWLE